MRARIKVLTICGIILVATSLLTACEDNSANNIPDVTDVAIPVTNEAADTSLDITASKDDRSQEEDISTTNTDDSAGRANDKIKEDTSKAAGSADNGTNTQTATPENPQIAQTPAYSQTETTPNSQANTSSSGSSYEQIYNEYCQKLADYYNTAKGELQSEVSSGKSIDALATSCSNKVNRLAEISTEGVNKMADLCVKRSGSTSDYMSYGTKLESVYMDYGTKLESVYMSGAVSNQTKSVQQSLDDLGISSDISGQYSEEMNKAMDQYNKEMDKALDEYNQQVQDMLREYGF